MNLEELRRKLVAAARTQSPPEHVPYAFEKRVMAMLSSRPVADLGALWAGALWRAAGPCIAIMVFLAAWSFFAADGRTPVTDLSQDFENTLLAVADQEPPSDLPQ